MQYLPQPGKEFYFGRCERLNKKYPPIPQRYFVRLAYRGTAYRGWQRQPRGVKSVQETIEKVLTSVQGKPTIVVGCGRTDAGVHASDYYLHFDAEGELRDKWLFIVNKQLPDDIVFYHIWPVASHDHTRYGARERTYDYFIHTRPDPFLAPVSSYYALENFVPERLQECLDLLVGRQDFRAFCITPDRHNTTVCDLREASLHKEGEHRYRLRFVADRYLRGMIRILTYQLLQVGKGKITPEEFASALESGERYTAKQAYPEGLFLSEIKY